MPYKQQTLSIPSNYYDHIESEIMMKKTTSATYRQRFTAVIEYMHDNINGDLGVNALADIAIMSPYHFHRIYRELMQETVNATVRRLRLQKAAIDLIRTDQSIQSIAQGISYGSVEAFSRAFSRQFCIANDNSSGQLRLHFIQRPVC